MAAMQCPACGGERSQIYDSRMGRGGCVRRRRACLICEHRYTTRETIDGDADTPPLTLSPEVVEAIDAAVRETVRDSVDRALLRYRRCMAVARRGLDSIARTRTNGVERAAVEVGRDDSPIESGAVATESAGEEQAE